MFLSKAIEDFCKQFSYSLNESNSSYILRGNPIFTFIHLLTTPALTNQLIESPNIELVPPFCTNLY